MKGIYTAGICINRLFSLLLIVLAVPTTADAGDRQIAVVKSSENSYFNQTIETLIDQVDDHFSFRIFKTDTFDASDEILQEADIIVTLGARAASNIASQSPDQLVINAYLTLQQTEQFQHHKKNHIAVLLNQPLERYLAFSKLLLNLKTLGTMNRSAPVLTRRQEKIRQKLNLKLDPYQLGDTNKDLLVKLRQLIMKNEALLMLPDQTIYNRDTLKGILLTTYRSRTPVISYSPGHVKSGALAAIYSSPVDIGRHIANLLNQHHKGRLNKKNRTIYAQYYSIETNQRVAHSLGLDLPGEEKIRQLVDEATK